MEFRQMQYFLCLAQTGHVTRAARQLNIVQPALSMQIAKLEAQLGQKLFDRSARGVTLTIAGEILMRLVAPIIRDVDRVKQEMTKLDGRIAGRVSVGLINSVAQSTLANSSARVAQAFPDVELTAHEGYSETLIEWVTAGQLDTAFINKPRRKLSLTMEVVLNEEMVLACRSSSATGIPSKLAFEHLSRLDLVLPSRRHGLRTILDDRAAEAKIELRPRLEMDTLTAICDVVSTTNLVTVLPSIALQHALTAGRVRAFPFRDRSITRSVVMISHPHRTTTPAARAVAAVFRQDALAAAAAASQHVGTARIRNRRISAQRG